MKDRTPEIDAQLELLKARYGPRYDVARLYESLLKIDGTTPDQALRHLEAALAFNEMDPAEYLDAFLPDGTPIGGK